MPPKKSDEQKDKLDAALKVVQNEAFHMKRSLDAKNLGALFEGQGRAGRADHEGSMWIVQADTDATLARQIASALKKEACKWRLD